MKNLSPTKASSFHENTMEVERLGSVMPLSRVNNLIIPKESVHLAHNCPNI